MLRKDNLLEVVIFLNRHFLYNINNMTTNIPDNAHNSDISIINYEVPEFITEIGNCAFFKCITL